MPPKSAAAAVTPVRQRTQFTCMAASMAMALRALGIETDEDTVNRVMGCEPMRGASWEEAIAAAQHYGARTVLLTPCTIAQLRAWTDARIPVLIAWNPEGREWSHASVVFDVTGEEGEETVHVADPNIPDPAETVREVPREEFYRKWAEKWPRYMVRRPAMAVQREITPEGRQVTAGKKEQRAQKDRAMSRFMRNGPVRSEEKSDTAAARDQARWDALKSQGKAGLPGADMGAGYHRDRSQYDRKREKGVDREASIGPVSPLRMRRDYGVETEIEENMKNGNTRYLLSADAFAEALKESKFEKGVSVSVDEVADVVGPEFKEMNENPPESVRDLKKEMQGKTAAHRYLLSLGRKGEAIVDSFPDPILASMVAAKVLGVPAAQIVSDEGSPAVSVGGKKTRWEDLFARMAAEAPDQVTPQRDRVWVAEVSVGSIYETNREAAGGYLLTAAEFKAALGDRTGKFERGVSMTVDEVAEVVGPAFKEMNEDPPDSVLRVREEMQGKTAAAGLYGFTRDVEAACQGACKRVGKSAARIARALYAKDENTAAFLLAHSKRARSRTARLLLTAMEEIGPTAKLKGKTAAAGLYGFGERTARLALTACSELHHEIGVVAADLNDRRAAQHEKITEFLRTHAKTARCAYSALLLEGYPDAPKTAADFLASEEEAENPKKS